MSNDNAGISNIFNISAQIMTRQIWLQLLFIIKIPIAKSPKGCIETVL
jgi:hypothetical protein